jgi:hypothetical protein
VLRISGSQSEPLILFRQCGEFFGGWVASPSGGFLAMVSGFSMACLKSAAHGNPTPRWLAAARSYAIRGSERELLAPDGRVLARLLPGGVAHAGNDMLASLADPPTLSAADRSKIDTPPMALPASAKPAPASALTGRWQPYPAKHYQSSKQPYLSFAADGSWTGTDGCNIVGGTLRVGARGELLNVSGPSTLIGCRGAPVGSFVPKSGRVAVSDGVLALYGENGKLLGKLIRT